MAYVYRHIRKDKNIPFYIGIGSDDAGKYDRAYNTKTYHRNRLWNKIATKSEIEVQILFDNISWEVACEKEMEFIALYGRINDGGSLANITLGGEGCPGLVHTEEAIRKNREAHLGKTAWNKGKPILQHVKAAMLAGVVGKPAWNKGLPMSEEAKKKLSESRKGLQPSHLVGRINTPQQLSKMAATKRMTVFQFTLTGDLVGTYDCAKSASIETGLNVNSIAASCRNVFGNRKTNKHGGFLWGYEKSLHLEAEILI